MIGGAQVKRLVGALDALRQASSPADRLASARLVREAAEKLEGAHIEAARAAGLTWAEIGTVYGLTKQGAQQRFRPPRDER
jgi:hypothetical protein